MTIRNMIKPTADNLRSKVATEPLTRWLISAAKQRTTLTYGEGKRRLEVECGFKTIFSMKMGIVVGAVMDKILERKPSAPLLNVLLVRGDTRQPGGGAREYLAEHFPKKKWLREKGAHKNYPDLWKRIVEQAAREVYAFPHWDDLYKRVSGRNYGNVPLDTTVIIVYYGFMKSGTPFFSISFTALSSSFFILFPKINSITSESGRDSMSFGNFLLFLGD